MSKYELNVDLNVLNHLGLNLYSNVSAVLSEVIANAWDAEARRVDISMKKNDRIVIKDNGCGMDDNDLRNKFLTVGYQRRIKEADITPKMKRPVMGRKGIGKLSTLSIAERVQIITKKENSEILAIELNVEEIKDAMDKNEIYHPSVISVPDGINLENSGTVLILSNFKKRILSSLAGHLRQRIARRFSIFSENFQVFIDDDEVTFGDRNYFKKLEHSLVYGNYSTNNFNRNEIPITKKEGKIKEGRYLVSGWIGWVDKPRQLQDKSGDNLNKISVIVRGKVAQEDILASFRESGLYTKYIVGELTADFLDSTDEKDIATSSRENFVESDERFSCLKDFVEQELKDLELQWREVRAIKGVKKAQEIPAIKKWYEKLRGGTKKAAKRLFGDINAIAIDDEHRKTLLKYSVLAFTHLRHKELLGELHRINAENLAVINLFSELDDIEANWYHQITEGRLDVIRILSDCVSKNEIERTIQDHIYNHLWLLDPSWDRATETPTLEQTVVQSFDEISDELTEEEQRGRIDIRYKKTSGKHVLIELKRSSVNIDVMKLIKQVRKYEQALSKQLKHHGEKGLIEIICLVGKLPGSWDDSPNEETYDKGLLTAANIQLITYQQLITGAELSYQSYLEKDERGEIQQILDEIDKFDYNA